MSLAAGRLATTTGYRPARVAAVGSWLVRMRGLVTIVDDRGVLEVQLLDLARGRTMGSLNAKGQIC